LKKTHLTAKIKYRLRIKGWKKVFQANIPQTQAGLAILIYDKVNFRLKLFRRDIKWHFILMKEIMQQEEISVLDLCVSNIEATNYIKKH
jgi:hypothetical protein